MQVEFEEVLSRRVAAPRVTQPEDRCGVGVTLLADAVPKPAEAIASERAGVVAQADVDVAQVASHIINSVRDDHTGGPTGEVVIEGWKRLLSPHAARAVQLSEVLFGLGIHGKDRVSSGQVVGLQLRNALELRVPIGRLAAVLPLVDLVQRQALVLQPIADDRGTDGRALLAHRLGDLSR